MKFLCLICLIMCNYINSQILPSYQATHYKKSSEAGGYWDLSEKASCITLSNSNSTAFEDNCTGGYANWHTVYNSDGVSSRTKEWEITVNAWDNDGTNSFDVLIGVSIITIYEDSLLSQPADCNSPTGFAYILQNGKKVNGCTVEYYGSSYNVEDVIKISLNMNNRELAFYKNGISQGVAYTVTSASTYYLAVSFTNGSQGKVTITG